VGDLHVVLAAGHDLDRHVRQVTQHHAAVVGRVHPTAGELRVGEGELVGGADRRQPEGLRSLSPAQPVPARHVLDDAAQVVVDRDDGVGRGDRDVDRVVGLQRGDALGDDPLVEERPDRVMEEQVAVVGGADGGDRPPGGLPP
jgi:hypothetical protein